MIWWLISNYATQVAYLVGAIWFANGLRKALFKPRLQYLEHTDVGNNALIKVRRQQLLPPWLTLEETWLVEFQPYYGYRVVRESDGRSIVGSDLFTGLRDDLSGLLEAARVRKSVEEEAERKLTEELERDLTKKRKLDDLIAQASR